MVKWDDDIYDTPAYPVTDAARYLHIPVGTLCSWLHGRYYPVKDGKQYFQALIQRPDPGLPQISFTNLVEAYVLQSIRKVHNVRLNKVRRAFDYFDQQLGMPHPLARVEFVKSIGLMLNRIEWNEQGIATRLFPATSDEPEDEPRSISIDPKISFGRPVVVGARIPTRAIAERYEASEPPESIADDFGCTLSQVHDAIRFELSLSRAA